MNNSNNHSPNLYSHSYGWIHHLLPIVGGYTARTPLNWVGLLRALQNLSWDSHMWKFMSSRGFRGVHSLTLSKQRWKLTASHMQYPTLHYRPILDILVRGLQQTFAFHGALRPLFLMRASSLAPVFLKRVYSKWMNFSTFLLNFFYWGGHVFSFGHPLLRQELEASNWSRKQWHIHEWLLVRSYFSTQMKRANERGAFFIRKLSSEWNCVCLFTHPIYHGATIHYLQRHKWPTVGLVDSSVNPWWFFFALPIPFTSIAVQMVSLRAVTVVKRWALSSRT